MFEFLKGKRTYLTVAVSVISALIAFANGEKDIAGLISALGVLLAQAFTRAGITNDVTAASK